MTFAFQYRGMPRCPLYENPIRRPSTVWVFVLPGRVIGFASEVAYPRVDHSRPCTGDHHRNNHLGHNHGKV